MTTAFNTAEFDLAYQDGVESTYWTMARNNIIYRAIKNAGLSNIPILEVGCGRGIVTKSLLQRNVDCVGVELADIKPLAGMENKVITAKDALDFPSDFRQRFKAIMLLDVIEHIENDLDFIQKLLQAYSNVEFIIITVPARKEIWSNFDDFYRHFRRYNLKMTKDLMEKLNFEIVKNKYFFKLIYIFILLQNKLNAKRNIEIVPPKGFVAKAMNKFLATYFIAENFIMPENTYGSSILCIARKRT